MAKFCTQCGRPLADGEICNCSAVNQAPYQAPPVNPNPGSPIYTNGADGNSVNINLTGVAQSASSGWAKFKNQIGIGDPLVNEGDTFEKNKKIIPDVVKPNDGEVPVRQYEVANLRNRFLGIPYMRAIGRVQVTNKRVIFRAPGNCIAGRTSLQHEFAIDEIAGIEARREYVFNFWDFLLALIMLSIGGGIGTGITLGLTNGGYETFLSLVISLILAAGAGALFFMVKKHWLLKLLGLGAAVSPLVAVASINLSGWGEEFVGLITLLLAIPFAIISLLTVFIYAIRPNLALVIKAKSASASEAIDIRRKKVSIFGFLQAGAQNESMDHTGYTEILPMDDAEASIRELGAVINDIQKLGDFGIEKWRQ